MPKSDWLDREEYSFDSRYFDVPAGRLHYVDEGSGPPVVMVHGNPTWSFLYRNLIKTLRPFHRCLAPDHIGFGLSDKPAGWDYLPQSHAANLTALIEALDLKEITLVVQDWGGPIGMHYAVNHPDNVARLIIMNTWAWPVDDDWYYRGFSGFMGGPIGRFLIRRFNFFARSVMRQAYGSKRKLTTALHSHYLNPLDSPQKRTGSHVFPREIIGASDWLADIWQRADVLSDKPKLIVWGMKDIAFREKELNCWMAQYPEAQVVRLPSVGHYVQDEAPAALADAVVPFLENTAV